MSRKYNTKHVERSRKAPRRFEHLADVETLRKRQERRVAETGSPWVGEQEEEAA